jgi:hypothetical protein
MRNRIVAAAVAAGALVAAVAGLSVAAAPKSYQFTGTVTEVDTKGKRLAVDKGGEVWEFATDGLKGVKLKKGDRVTVQYQMLAKKVETK